MKLDFNHSLVYTNTGVIPVHEVAESLLANDALIRNAALVLGRCVDGLSIERVDVYFKEATHASPLRELFLATLLVTYQEELGKEVPDFITKLTGIEVSEKYDTMLTVFVLIVAYYGMDYLYRRFVSDKAPKNITENKDKLIFVAGDYLDVSQDRIREAAAEIISGTRKLSVGRATRKLIAPTKREKEAIIRANKDYEIPRHVINETPSDIDLEFEEDAIISAPYQDVEIVLRAEDADRSKHGWAGIATGVHDGRLKMEIYPDVDKDAIFGKKRIKGDIVLVSKKQPNDSYQPIMFHLVKLKNEQ